MTEEKRVITRRDFLRAGVCVAAGSVIGLPLLENNPVRADEKSRVALVRDMDVFDVQGMIRSDVLEKMLDRAVSALMDAAEPQSAWKKLVTPGDIVGIKSNVWHYLPTPAPLEATIQKRLQEAGVRQENMAVDDRGVLANPVFQHATVLINVRPMRTHHWSGLGTLIKNYIMFVRRPSDYHANACENLGAIWRLPHVTGKTRLNILVMLTPLFHGFGPHNFSREHTWNYCGLIVSTDPVAADATGARIIQAKRESFFGTKNPLSPPARHIAAADTRFGLGHSRPEQIHVIKLGSDKDFLI
jgi:hypothetical protein